MYCADVSKMRSLCHYQYAQYSQSANCARLAPNAPVSQSPRQPEDKTTCMCHSNWVGSNHTFQSADKLYSTAVLAGLMRIADDPGILSVKEVPVSLWLRSDPDETTGEDDGKTVIRICTQGQDTNDTGSVRDRVSVSHPVH